MVENPDGKADAMMTLEHLGGVEVQLDLIAGRSCLPDWFGWGILAV